MVRGHGVHALCKMGSHEPRVEQEMLTLLFGQELLPGLYQKHENVVWLLPRDGRGGPCMAGPRH